jgi:hypothetical protein
VVAGFLAGCGTSAAPPSSTGVLTAADIPHSLGLAENHSDTSVNLGKSLSQAYPGCSGHFAAFTVGGRVPTPDTPGTKIYLEVFSESSSCRDAAKATTIFAKAAKAVEEKNVGGTPLSGIGDSGVIARAQTGGADDYALFWRNGAELGFIELSGPARNRSISTGQIKTLARRQVDRQSGVKAGG